MMRSDYFQYDRVVELYLLFISLTLPSYSGSPPPPHFFLLCTFFPFHLVVVSQHHTLIHHSTLLYNLVI